MIVTHLSAVVGYTPSSPQNLAGASIKTSHVQLSRLIPSSSTLRLPPSSSLLSSHALFALVKSCKDLDFRLQPSIWKYNIGFQNSNLLHLADKYDNVGVAEALLQHNANINAFYRGKAPLMRALKYSSAAVRELLLNRRVLDINIQNKRTKAPCRMPSTTEPIPP